MASIVGIVLITLAGVIPLVPVALAKRVARSKRARERAGRAAIAVARYWARACNAVVIAISGVRVSLQHEAGDSLNGRFVLIGNHQCAADPLFLVYALDGRFPFPRFCLKRSLRRLPVIGLAFWALGYIFVDRHSREAVRRNPALRGRDAESIEHACRGFRDHSITFVNYPEGTRSTAAKRRAVDSPYKTLLPPRTGGLRYAVRGFGASLDGMLDLSIGYVDAPAPTLWAVLTGRISTVVLRLQRLEVPPEFLTADATSDPDAVDAIRAFLEARWRAKDKALAEIQSPASVRRGF